MNKEKLEQRKRKDSGIKLCWKFIGCLICFNKKERVISCVKILLKILFLVKNIKKE